MPSSFMGLYVQREAILLAQKSLDVTGNNISNINTPGYSRQRVDVCAVANKKGTLYSNTAVSLAGRGVDAIGVAQLRDRLLDKKVRNYSSDLCNVGIKTSVLSDVEDVFDSIESDENEASFTYIMSEFKAALQGFSADHADRSELANVAVNSAESLVQAIVTYNRNLNDISDQTYLDAEKTVVRINAIFQEMGTLNKQIMDSYVQMGYYTPTLMNYEVMNDYGPLELKDSMNSLLDELSQYGNIDFAEEEDGSFTVEFAGQTVVSKKNFAQMAITTEDPKPTELEFEISEKLMDKDEWYDLNIKHGTEGMCDLLVRQGLAGDTVNITGKNADGIGYILNQGSLRGYLDVYNGRGFYAHEPVYTDAPVIEVNELLTKLKNGASGDEKTEIQDKLVDLLGAVKNADGTLTVGGTEDADGNITGGTVLDGTKLFAVTDDGKLTLGGDPITVKGTVGNTARNGLADISNGYKGIEYYRDMLNSFVKTATEEFNGIFEGYGKIFTCTDTTAAKEQITRINELMTKLNDNTASVDEILEFANLTGTEVTGNGAGYTVTLNGEAFDTSKELSLDSNGDVLQDGKAIQPGGELGSSLGDFRTAAEHFRVTENWLNNPEFISNPTGQNKYEELDNVYINKMLGVIVSKHTYGDGDVNYGSDAQYKSQFTLEGFVAQISIDLGGKLSSETGVYNSTNVMLTGMEKERSGKMDVSMNEEGINMMTYQKWYNAIARMITTMDEALDKLINGTGVVGLR